MNKINYKRGWFLAGRDVSNLTKTNPFILKHSIMSWNRYFLRDDLGLNLLLPPILWEQESASGNIYTYYYKKQDTFATDFYESSF